MTSQPRKQFGHWTLTFLVVANMIGAGVFVTSGFSMGDLHSPGLIVVAWAVAGLIAIAGAVSYGKLIQHMPESGGEYLFLSRAYHPMFGFIAGWVSMFAGFTAAIAFAALTFEEYAGPQNHAESVGACGAILFASSQVEGYVSSGWGLVRFWLPDSSTAIVVVLIAALIHGIKVKVGARAQNLAVILKLLLLFGFLAYACLRLQPGEVVNELEPVQGTNLMIAFARQLMYMSLSYMGFNAAVYIADEVDDASNVVPRALLWGTTIVVVLYVALNFVFVFSADAQTVEQSGPTVAAMAAQSLGGAWFRTLFTIIISAALLTSVTSMMMAAPRVYAKMADDGMLPSLFRFQKETPVYSIVLQTILACVIIWFSSLKDLLGYLGITLSLCAAVSVTSLFLPRFRGERSWFSLYYLAPAFYVGATILAVTMSYLYQEQGGAKSVYAALITFGVGAAMYGLKQLWNASTKSDSALPANATSPDPESANDGAASSQRDSSEEM